MVGQRRKAGPVTDFRTPYPGTAFRHPAGPELDTAEEQASVLLHDLRESFAPSYLTLISIIEGVLLGLGFELIATGHTPVDTTTAALLAFNNLLLIVVVWNEYRMGSAMFRWVPTLQDALIPFMVGAFQAALLLTGSRPLAWLAWLAAFYATAILAYANMYRRSAEEERNAFVLTQNRPFQRLNLAACAFLSGVLWLLYAQHRRLDTTPGWRTLAVVTLINLVFAVRGDMNWRRIVSATRAAAGPLAEIEPRQSSRAHADSNAVPAPPAPRIDYCVCRKPEESANVCDAALPPVPAHEIHVALRRISRLQS